MLLRVLRFATLVLLIVSLGAALAHLYEMPAKLRFDGVLWLTLLQRLYPTVFGPVAGVAEALSIIGAVVLVFLVRRREGALPWTVMAAACLLASHAIFWVSVAPVNAALVPLTPETLPTDWSRLRDQWEFSHAIRAILQLIAMLALLISVLRETPLDSVT